MRKPSENSQTKNNATSPQNLSGGRVRSATKENSKSEPAVRNLSWLRTLLVLGMVVAAFWFILQVLLYGGTGMDEESIIVLGLLAIFLFLICGVFLVRAIRSTRSVKKNRGTRHK